MIGFTTIGIVLLLAQGGGPAIAGAVSSSLEAGRTEIRRFKDNHGSGDVAAAAAMLIKDPTFRIEREEFTLPKKEFLNWTLRCTVLLDDELPPPPRAPNTAQVVNLIWFECPAYEGITRPELATRGKSDRFAVRTSFISEGRGIEMR